MTGGGDYSGYAQAMAQVTQAAGALYGGIKDRKAQRKNVKRNIKYQREFAQNGISWRVADAKRAGIHPLYAMGSPGASFNPVHLGGEGLGPSINRAGQHISGAVNSLANKGAREEERLRLKLLESQINETDARTGLIHSEAARNKQNANIAPVGAQPQLGVMNETDTKGTTIAEPMFIYEGNLNGSLFTNPNNGKSRQVDDLRYFGQSDLPGAGLINRKPSEVTTHKKGNRGLVAGEHPAFKEYRLPNGLPVLLPAGDTLSEVLEETPMWMYKSIYEMNKKKYGEQWADEFLDFLWKGGGTTKKKRPSFESRQKAREWYNKGGRK